MTAARSVSERTIVLLVAAVQFINILDFVMVMPMGPDFARALGIPASNLGFIGGAYTAAAAVSGLAGSFFLDRFDRRHALGVAMLGLVFGTAMGGVATGMSTLLLARFVAGFFGGPATSIALSIVADVVPPGRRGKAMGLVMGAFALASVVGIPTGLYLATVLGWRAPFFAVAALGVIVACGAVFFMPPMRGHLGARRQQPRLAQLVQNPNVLLSWTMTFVVMMGGFLLIPNISAYVQENLGYPRADLGKLYLFGGMVSLFATQLAGRAVDRWGSFRSGTVGTGLLIIATFCGYVMVPPPWPVMAIFLSFFLAIAFRNVPYNTLTTRVPGAGERARFMSIQSAVQNTAAALGAFLSARLLSELPDHKLVGMQRVAGLSIALTAVLPIMLFIVERGVKRKELSASAAPPNDPVTGLAVAGSSLAQPVSAAARPLVGEPR